MTLADVSPDNLEAKGNQEMIDFMNANLGVYNAEDLLVAQTWSDEAIDAYFASPEAIAVSKTTVSAPHLFTYERMRANAVASYPDVAAAQTKAESLNELYYSSAENATAENQKAAATALRELYALILSKPSTAMPSFDMGQYASMTVTSDNSTPPAFAVTVPGANTSSVVTNIKVEPRAEGGGGTFSPDSAASYSVVNGVPTISGTFDNIQAVYAITNYSVIITADVDGAKT